MNETDVVIGNRDTHALIVSTWSHLGARRLTLPRLYYHRLVVAEPSLPLIYSEADMQDHSHRFVELMEALVAGQLAGDELTSLGRDFQRSGFQTEQVEQFIDVLLTSIAGLHGVAWSAPLEAAWINLLGRAGQVIQRSARRRLFA